MGLGVEFHYGVSVTHVEEGMVIAGGEEIAAEQVLICSGDDFETLFPDRFAAFGMTRSKLQMLRAKPKRSGYEIGAHLCAGLTLGHYANFRLCDRLAEVVARHGRELPEHAQWGIHLLVSQHEDGCLTIGDSHEYGLAVDPFLSEHIEHLILEYLDTFLPTEDFDVIERWHGVYAKHPSRNYLIECLLPGVTLLTGVGGAGMTLSFGIAENALRFAGILS
jgi:FAD dependent oxidoreductase TIGR03364